MNLLLTVRETAAHLKVSERTIIRMIKRGEIKAHKVGPQLRIEAALLPGYGEEAEKK